MSSQSQRLAALTSSPSEHPPPPHAHPPPTVAAARHADVPPTPLTPLLLSASLSIFLMVVCGACYCCGRASRTRKPRYFGAPTSGVYSVPVECSHNTMFCDSIDPYYHPSSFRRPPTPGPPPAYDSVVSSTDKLRRFGINDEEAAVIKCGYDKYIIEGSMGPDELLTTMPRIIKDHEDRGDDKIERDERHPCESEVCIAIENHQQEKRRGILKNATTSEAAASQRTSRPERTRRIDDETLPSYEAALHIGPSPI